MKQALTSTTGSSLSRSVTVAAMLLWLAACAKLLINEIDHPWMPGIVMCTVLMLAPVIVAKISRLGVYLLGAYAAAIPLSGLAGGGGLTLMKLLGIAVAGALMFSTIAKGKVAVPSKPLTAVLLLTVYAGATVLWAIDSQRAIAAYAILLTYAGLFVVTSLYPFTIRDTRFVLGAFVFGGVVAACSGVYLFWHGQQFTGGVALGAGRLYIGYDTGGRMIDPNQFGAMLLIPISIVMATFARARFVVVKMAYGSALLLMLLASVLSASRGAAIGLAVAFTFILWRSKRRFALLAGAGVFLGIFINSPLLARFMASDVNSADGRFDIWRVGVASLQQYWLAGAGIGNFNEAFQQYYLAVPHMYLSWDRVSHSVPLQSAVEYGIIGFALVMSLWYFAFRDLARVPFGSMYSDVCIGLRAGILALFVAGFSLDLMSHKYVWLALSLVAVMRAGLRDAGIPVDASPTDVYSEAGVTGIDPIPPRSLTRSWTTVESTRPNTSAAVDQL